MVTDSNNNSAGSPGQPAQKGVTMKNFSRKSSLMMAVALMGCFAENASAAASENTAGTDAATPQKVGAAVKQLIINGRMPVAVVAQIRFGNMKDDTTKAIAEAFGTTVGKVDDIKKNRNFAYVTADFKPTAEQKAVGISWLKSHPYYDAKNVDKLVTELDATPEANAEEAAAFEAVRVQARGQQPTTKEGEQADAGGGNRRAPRKGKAAKDAAPAADAAATGDALLA